jgi:hypothetical protein
VPGVAHASAAPGTAALSQLDIEAHGAGEWIVRSAAHARALHVYQLTPGDWLVSEVGRGSEGRGPDLAHALRALAAEAYAPAWWELVASELTEHARSSPPSRESGVR